MKWIGQHIWDFISRFRSTVYLEDLDTSSEQNVLVVDSDGKVTKNTTLGGDDLTITNASDHRIVTSEGGSVLNAESLFTYNTGTVSITDTGSGKPQVGLYNINNDDQGSGIVLKKITGSPASGDEIGSIGFQSHDSASGEPVYARIVSEIQDPTNTDEAGKLLLQVATSNGSTSALQPAVTATGHGTNNDIDINLGHGATSITAMAGGFSAASDGGGTLTYNTDTFTLLSSESTRPKINLMNNHVDAEAPMLQFFKLPTGADDDEIGEILFSADDDADGPLTYATFKAYIADASNNDEAGKLEMKVATNSTEIQNAFTATGLGTASRVDVSLGHGAASTTTIAGTLTMGSTAFVNNSGVVQVATQGTIDHDSLANFVANEHIDWTGDVSASSVIHKNNITNLHGAGVDGSANQLLTDDGDGTVTSEAGFTWDGDDAVISSATTQKPVIEIKNTTDDTAGPTLKLNNTKGGSTNGAYGDYSGKITFNSVDASQNAQQYGSIFVRTDVATHNQESGSMSLQVAAHNGGSVSGLSLTGGSENAEVDVNIGTGANSVTTVAGDLTVNGEDSLFTSATSEKPVVEIRNTNTDGQGPTLKLNNTKGGSTDGSSGDYAGKITFNAMDDGTPSTQEYGAINVRVGDATSTEESGSMNLMVATHDGTSQTGISLAGGSASNEVDVTVGSGFESVTTVSGDLTVTRKATIPTRVYSYPGTSDGDHTAGDIMYYDSATASTTAGKIYYFNGSGSWTIANADAVADATGMLAVALGTNPDVDGMLLRGFVTLYDINGTEDHGAKLYLHTADGEASTTAPGSGNVVRVLGYNLHNVNDPVYFNPDNSWVEVS